MKKIKLWNTLPSDDAKKIMKDKTLSENGKFEKIVDVFCEFYKEDLAKQVRNCTLENYYEQIYDKDGQPDQELFAALIKRELHNEVHANIIQLNDYVNQLGKEGLNPNLLNDQSYDFLCLLAYTDGRLSEEDSPSLKEDDNLFEEFYNGVKTLNKKYGLEEVNEETL